MIGGGFRARLESAPSRTAMETAPWPLQAYLRPSGNAARRLEFMNGFADFLTECRRVMFAMNRNRVLHGGIDEFVSAVRGDGYGAFHLARKFAAVDKFASHCLLHHKPSAGLMPPEGRDSTPLAGTDKQASSATHCGEESARQKKQTASTSTAWIARHPPFIPAAAECATIAMSSDGNRVREPASSKFENSVSGDGCENDPTSPTILERSSKQPGQADQIHLQPHSHCLPPSPTMPRSSAWIGCVGKKNTPIAPMDPQEIYKSKSILRRKT